MKLWILVLVTGCGLTVDPPQEEAPFEPETEEVTEALEQWECGAKVTAGLTASTASINWTVKNVGAGNCSQVTAIVRRCNNGSSDCTQVSTVGFALSAGATRVFSRAKPSCAAGQTLHVHTVFFPAPGTAPVYSFGQGAPCL
jgi:hypothetical protein